MCMPNQSAPPPQSDPGVNPNTPGAPVIQPKQPSNIRGKAVGGGIGAAGEVGALLTPVLGPAAIIAPLVGGLVSALMRSKPKTPIQTPATPTFNGTPAPAAPSLQVNKGTGIAPALVSSGSQAAGSLANMQNQKNQMTKQNDLYQQLIAAMRQRNQIPAAPGPTLPQELPIGPQQ